MHRMDARAKLVLMMATGCAAFALDAKACAVFLAAASALSFSAGIGARAQAASLKGALLCFLFIFALQSASSLLQGEPPAAAFLPSADDARLGLRMAASMLSASLFYRATSPLELRMAMEDAARRLPGGASNRGSAAAESISLFFVFIPMATAAWKSLDLAWKSRCAKGGARKMLALVPALFSVCARRAYETSLAVQNRT